jgi:hypothetical protein
VVGEEEGLRFGLQQRRPLLEAGQDDERLTVFLETRDEPSRHLARRGSVRRSFLHAGQG